MWILVFVKSKIDFTVDRGKLSDLSIVLHSYRFTWISVSVSLYVLLHNLWDGYPLTRKAFRVWAPCSFCFADSSDSDIYIYSSGRVGGALARPQESPPQPPEKASQIWKHLVILGIFIASFRLLLAQPIFPVVGPTRATPTTEYQKSHSVSVCIIPCIIHGHIKGLCLLPLNSTYFE